MFQHPVYKIDEPEDPRVEIIMFGLGCVAFIVFVAVPWAYIAGHLVGWWR